MAPKHFADSVRGCAAVRLCGCAAVRLCGCVRLACAARVCEWARHWTSTGRCRAARPPQGVCTCKTSDATGGPSWGPAGTAATARDIGAGRVGLNTTRAPRWPRTRTHTPACSQDRLPCAVPCVWLERTSARRLQRIAQLLRIRLCAVWSTSPYSQPSVRLLRVFRLRFV